MASYSLGLTPLINDLLSIESGKKHVAFLDDLIGAGKLHNIDTWWEHFAIEAQIMAIIQNLQRRYWLSTKHK